MDPDCQAIIPRMLMQKHSATTQLPVVSSSMQQIMCFLCNPKVNDNLSCGSSRCHQEPKVAGFLERECDFGRLFN
jgi:hypothetical protein